MKSKWTLAYYLVYTVRRILFVFIAFFITHQAWQLVLLQYMNMFVIMYHLFHLPLDSKLKNKIEVVNEIFIGIITFHMCFFTDWVPSYDTQYALGWSMIFWTFICIIFNLVYVINYAQHHLWMVRMREKDKIDNIKSKVTKENAIKFRKYVLEKCCKKRDKEPPKSAIEADGHNQKTMAMAVEMF